MFLPQSKHCVGMMHWLRTRIEVSLVTVMETSSPHEAKDTLLPVRHVQPRASWMGHPGGRIPARWHAKATHSCVIGWGSWTCSSWYAGNPNVISATAYRSHPGSENRNFEATSPRGCVVEVPLFGTCGAGAPSYGRASGGAGYTSQRRAPPRAELGRDVIQPCSAFCEFRAGPRRHRRARTECSRRGRWRCRCR